MRSVFIPFLLSALLMPVVANPQQGRSGATPASDSSKFSGVWRGQFDNLPGVDLVITDEGGTPHGAVLFYLHRRADAKSPYTSTPGLPEPMLNLHLEDGALFFEVSHRRAHPPGTLHDPPVKFHLKLTGPNQAELGNESEGAPGLPMKRSDF